ncbi:galectin-4-like [Osmerus mordax]|uniref:galectin-4-like n=1 Tax=Osmerus mordax TaxID=8014 RepID=UPI00350F743C
MFVAPPGYQPVYSPSIPYVGPIYGGLRAGMSIYIQGSIPHHITRFTLNLQCGEFEGTDIAVHINPRFDGWDKVVFNSFQNGSWGSEDKTHDMPFKKGEAFEMVIVVTVEGYQFKVNGRDFHSFSHCIPVERVCALSIAGDVAIQTINVMGGAKGQVNKYPGGRGGGGGMGGYPAGGMGGGMGGYPAGGMGGGMGGYPGGTGGGYPAGGMGGGMGRGYPGEMGGGGGYPGQNLPVMGGQPRYNPPIPYCEPIPGGMSSKRTIVIRGMVPIGADRFSVNFKVSSSGEVAFHMNPRVREGVVIRNSMIGGSWGQEERELSLNPFLEGQYFDMSIRCGNQRYKVFVNGQHMCDFFHRYQAFNQVDMLELNGDVQISYVHF